MAQVPSFLGDVRKGDHIQFAVDDFMLSWDPLYFDVFDNQTRLAVVEDRLLVDDTDSPLYMRFVDFKLDDDFDTDGTRIQTYVEGRMYSIRVKAELGDPNPTDGPDAFMVNFRVHPEDRRAFIGTVEKGKSLHFMHREEDRSAMFFDVWDSKDDVTSCRTSRCQSPANLATTCGKERSTAKELMTSSSDKRTGFA